MNDIEDIIDQIKDSIGYADLEYEGGQSIDRKSCPFCGASEVIKYNTKQHISMNTLDHEDDCAYTLIRKLERKLIKD